MGRIVKRQEVRAAVSAKEMVAEYHEHWEWYDEDFDAFYGEDTGDGYPFAAFNSNDEIDRMIAGDFDDYPDVDFDDYIPPMDYHHEHYLETTYHP